MDVVEPLIVDLCTGSGAIALAMAQEVPRSRVHAVELSEDALRWTRKNAEGSRGLPSTRARGPAPCRSWTARSTWSSPTRRTSRSPSGSTWPPRPGTTIPRWRCSPGEDGLDTIRGIERTAHRLLRPGGIVVIEHADTQGGQVPWIFAEERGWADAADHPDLRNRPALRDRSQGPAVTGVTSETGTSATHPLLHERPAGDGPANDCQRRDGPLDGPA